tara:strand:- start:9887 stop:12616 length:2730 start_codon:yes stop_codon:yes gene_type:complete
MSVQLILYPQNYEGQYSVISQPVFNQYVSNFSFNSQASITQNISNPSLMPIDALEASLPFSMWTLFHSNGGNFGTTNTPTISSGKLTIDSPSGSTGASGCFQKIDNLQVGASYDLEITRLTSGGITSIGTPGSYTVGGQTFDTIKNGTILSGSIGTHTLSFTATNSTMVFVLTYFNSDNTNLEINAISIRENVSTAPTVDIFKDGQVICDLYEESYIPLSLSVDDFKNIHEKKQSFSKPFKLPATKRNNKIFTSLFDVTKSVKDDVFSFHPYKRTKAILKENGYTIFDGHLKLIDIVNKDGEISYNVNLFGDTITLADTLKDRKFDEIDLTELEHEYVKTNIVATETATGVTYLKASTSGYRTSETIKYPVVKWNGNSQITGGNVVLNRLQDFYRPFINCKYLLDRIMNESGFTYQSDFLNSTDFTELYMDFNFGKQIPVVENQTNYLAYNYDAQATTTSYTNIATTHWGSSLNTTPGGNPSFWSNTNHKLTASASGTIIDISYDYNFKGLSSPGVFNFRWCWKDSSGNVKEEIDLLSGTVTGTFNVSGFFQRILDAGDTLEPQWKSDTAGKYIIEAGFIDTTNFGQGNNANGYITIQHQVDAIITNSILQTIRGKHRQWDFVKSISTMFNLIFMQDKDNQTNIIIEPYQDVYITGSSQYITHKTLDWTSKVDITEHKSKPLTLKKNVKVKYKNDEKDYDLGLYKETTQIDYGQAEREQIDFTILQGEEKVETPLFSATYIRPYASQFSLDLTIPIINEEKEGEFLSYENTPRILYNIGQKSIDVGGITLPAQNGQTEQTRTNFLQFSHLTEIPTTNNTKDYNFETIGLIGSLGNTPVDNLYNLYWFNYYDELYNPDTRVINMKLYLTPADIENFEFYYKIRIKNREYRVNKIDYKPYELSNVEFILIG